MTQEIKNSFYFMIFFLAGTFFPLHKLYVANFGMLCLYQTECYERSVPNASTFKRTKC